jgi:hypothetical protein
MTNSSRDTTTGLKFEEYAKVKCDGVNVSKNALYSFLKKKNIDWSLFLSRKLLPDEAYWNEETKTLSIFEKKYQQTEGSADEKPQTCGFKIWQFEKIGKALGAKKVTYTYILSDWFKQPKYKDMLEYIRMINGCNYLFCEDLIS